MLQDIKEQKPSAHLKVVNSASGVSNASSKTIKPKKKAFAGFSDSDIATTRAVQELYYKKFSAKRIPQDEVASIVDWSQSTLNLYINGKQRIGDTALRKFCILLEVSPEDISDSYKASQKTASDGKAKELSEMKSILADLVDAVGGKRDIELIVMRAKEIVNS